MKSIGLASSLSFVGLTTVGMLLAGTQSAIGITISDKDVDNLQRSSLTSTVDAIEGGGFKYTYRLFNGEDGTNYGLKIASFIVPLLGNTGDYIRDVTSPDGWQTAGVKTGIPAAWPAQAIDKPSFKSPDFYIEWITSGGLGYNKEAEFSFESDYDSTQAPYVAFWDGDVSPAINYTVGDPPIPGGPPAAVPTPSLLVGVLGMGAQMWRKKRQQIDA